MRLAGFRLGALAAVLSFSTVFGVARGNLYGSFCSPECQYAGRTYLPNTPCNGVYYSQDQLQEVEKDVQQARLYQQQPQMANSLRLQHDPVNYVDQYTQNSLLQNFNAIPRMYRSKGDDDGRFKRQVPYQMPDGLNPYGNYMPYQDRSTVQSLAGLQSLVSGFQSNNFQQTGFNQFGGLLNAYQQMNPTYNAYSDSPNRLGYSVQQWPSSLPGFQVMGQNMYRGSYGPSFGPYSQGSYRNPGLSNYPVVPCLCGRGSVPLCQMSSNLPETTTAPPPSKWLNYDQLKAFLTQYPGLQQANSWNSHVIAPTSPPTPVARNFELLPSPKEPLTVATFTKNEALVSYASPPVEAPTTTPTKPAQSIAPTEPPTSAPESSPPSVPPTAEAPHPLLLPVQYSPALMYASTSKPIRAQRSMLDE